MVIAAAEPAARAGVALLAAGGNAADAAVATAAMLGVVDPQNCGVGGYGGFAVVDDGRTPPRQIAFNTTVPRAFDPATPPSGRRPGSLVSPPGVVPGLAVMHGVFGRLPWRDCWAPAIAAAREGIAVGRDLAAALRWARERHHGLNTAFRATFLPGDAAPSEGQRLIQPELAQSLEAVAAEAGNVLRRGALPQAFVATVRATGGILDHDDLAALDARVGAAEEIAFGSARVYAPDREESGGAILLDVLAELAAHPPGLARGEDYVRRIGSALARAWARRDAEYAPLAPPGSQTTHLCAADRDGMLVALTFTHGPTWFGSGLVAEGTGVVLNGGTRLFVRRRSDGRCLAQTNLTPTILHDGADRYALGTPGARRIPAVVLQLVLDLARYRMPLAEALAAARLSASADGALDGEAPLVTAFPHLRMKTVVARDYYGPAGALRRREATLEGATDPRFAGACVAHEPL
jgi:gamma-glutamyltranspeptidase/glutathione hydrolase